MTAAANQERAFLAPTRPPAWSLETEPPAERVLAVVFSYAPQHAANNFVIQANCVSTRLAAPSEALKTWAIRHATALSSDVDEVADDLLAARIVRGTSASRKLGRR